MAAGFAQGDRYAATASGVGPAPVAAGSAKGGTTPPAYDVFGAGLFDLEEAAPAADLRPPPGAELARAVDHQERPDEAKPADRSGDGRAGASSSAAVEERAGVAVAGGGAGTALAENGAGIAVAESGAGIAVTERPRAPQGETNGRPDRGRRRRRRNGRGRSERAAEQAGADRSAPARADRPAPAGELPDEDLDVEAPEQGTGVAREMIINVTAGDECRIAVLEGGRLEELFIERQSAESHVGSIYKGRVTNVEPSIQAVFVDFGRGKNGFLHISDVHPQYFPNGGGASEDVGKKIPRRDRPAIQKCFRRGQEVVVQVTKEGIGTKGPTLTTYLSIPGRFLVMMPGMSRLGVSRKIEDDNDRRAMREILGQLDLPEGLGFIVRTAGLGRTKRELQRDLNYLNRLWKIVSDRIHKTRAPAEVYQESDLVVRTIRDVLTSDFKRIVVDDEPTAEKAREFLKIALPRTQDLVEVCGGHEPIFHKFGIEQEIERINSRHVPLPLGGSLVIDSTEAMVAIDVNSGKFRDVDDAEQSAYRLNLQAAQEIARQLRLRDLGGLIVCDFIDMRLEKHKRAVERELRNALKKHKERARLLRMSAFGLIEMTRQRQRSSIRRSIYTECPHCKGSGMVKSAESMVLEVMRVLQLAAHHQNVRKVLVTVSPGVAFLVQNARRAQLHELESQTGTTIAVRGEPQYALDQFACECEDERGRPVPVSL